MLVFLFSLWKHTQALELPEINAAIPTVEAQVYIPRSYNYEAEYRTLKNLKDSFAKRSITFNRLPSRAKASNISRQRSSNQTGLNHSIWEKLANCESGGDWAANTGNGYYGGLQFKLSTWHGIGGTGYPHTHPKETQIFFAKKLQAKYGWGQWPDCSRRLGLS